jgi:Carboxypeptidase regulatory-like domain
MRRLLLLIVVVLVPATSGAAVAQAAEGTIRGTVTPSSIAQEVEVCVAEPQPPEICTAPAANGSYSLTGLQTRPLKIEFIPPYRSRLMVEYWDHVYTLGEATAVPLSSNAPLVEGVDAALAVGGVIEGTVTGAGGPPLAGVEVCALAADGASAGCSATDAAGEYELHSLSPGSYRVRFFPRGPSAGYLPEYYVGAKTLAAATPISLAAGAVRAGVDAHLTEGGQVRGTVTAAAGGASIDAISVCLFHVGAPAAERCVFSDAGGRYAFAGLASGEYQVGFALSGAAIDGEAGAAGEAGGYLSQYYDGVASRAAARPVSVLGAEVVEGIDAALLTAAPPAQPPSVAPPAQPLVAAPLPLAEPKKPRKHCRRGYRKEKRKGRIRCVRKKHSKKRSRHHHRRR